MSKKKYTIKDIAKLAGVSKGTVDRVLHNRGKVSQKAYEKVNEVLKKIDYHPNPIARNLKNNKVYGICVILPDPEIDPYWMPAQEGIIQASEEFIPFGVMIEPYFYHPNEVNSFVEKSSEALETNPDALLMAPLFHNESLRVLQKCQDEGKVLASFNNVIDRLHNENFIGQDLFQSGRVAASLIDKMLPAGKTVGIVHINLEPHMQQKEKGFKSYFTNHQEKQIKILTQELSTEESPGFETQTVEFLNAHPEISALFVTNSKAHMLVEVLQEIGSDIIVVGYDLLEENIRQIKKGGIDFLIHQKPKSQAYLGIGQLAEHFLFGKPIPSQKLLPIDVVTSENLKYYLN